MDFDTEWCPVCEKRILPKHTQIPIAIPAAKRGSVIGVTTKTRTIIDQGPYPLYCSEQCRLRDQGDFQENVNSLFVYPLYSSSDKSNSFIPDFDSVSSDAAQPSYEHSQLHVSSSDSPKDAASTRNLFCQRLIAPFPSSLPSNTEDFLNTVSFSFSHCNESRERSALSNGTAGKLLVPDVFVRIPSSTSLSKPTPSGRSGSSNLAGNASLNPPPSRSLDIDTLDEEASDDVPLSPRHNAFTLITPRRSVVEARSWSYHGSAVKKPSTTRDDSALKRQSYNPDGKRLFLFPTD
ncbi:hypothetical protein K435DRAFT_966577 [Dendrothele bispora CBS 962.96]|uniref:Uncharacterized protein n=1 Tax=Dendrothele bispora (strain CBS 962.96) TaxID=1314807 RepID=A0A4S8LZZ7_DENBC|nr:hypothetical protein K435DRAFT_966577 [Dendrothele bispora CBS 962.96]